MEPGINRIRTWHYDSPLGGMTLAGAEDVLCGLWFDGQKHFGGAQALPAADGWLPVFGEACRWLDIYFSGREPDFTPPLSLHATPFRTAVWEALRTIPFGQTRTYADIARQIADRSAHASPAVRAVGAAAGHNPISLIIPCHRVIGSDGSLTGYAGGLERKERLLALEQGRIL